MVNVKRNAQSYLEGTSAEQEFIALRGNNYIRKSSKEEDINEHWDLLDSEFGRVDVKAAKRFSRSGEVTYTIWWELKTVKRPPNWQSTKGWGVPNGINRFIAVRGEKAFYLIDPDDIYLDLRKMCTEYYKGDFGLYNRQDRGDLMTILPLSYVKKNSKHIVAVY